MSKECLNIEINIKNLVINRLKNPKFANNEQVAESLGISVRNLYEYISRYNIKQKDYLTERKARRRSLKYQNL